MRCKKDACITISSDYQIKFEENHRKILFMNPKRLSFKKVQVDGCIIKDDGIRCDNLLLSNDEREERYVELKGIDVKYAIDQIEATIKRLGEFDDNRHSYIICTNVAPAYNTHIQLKQKYFKEKYKSELIIREKQYSVTLHEL